MKILPPVGQSAGQDRFNATATSLGATMTTPIRHAAAWMLSAVASCAAPAYAQNNAATAAMTASADGTETSVPFDQTERNRNREQQLLGTPREFGDSGTQHNIDDAQRAALLDGQHVTVTAGQPARRTSPSKAPTAANGPLRAVAQQPGRPNAGPALPAGATKNPYADPYGAGKRSVYRSPW